MDLKNVKEKVFLEDLTVNWRIILKLTLKKHNVQIWAALSGPQIWCSKNTVRNFGFQKRRKSFLIN